MRLSGIKAELKHVEKELKENTPELAKVSISMFISISTTHFLPHRPTKHMTPCKKGYLP